MTAEVENIERLGLNEAYTLRWKLRRTCKASRDLTEIMVKLNSRIRELGGA